MPGWRGQHAVPLRHLKAREALFGHRGHASGSWGRRLAEPVAMQRTLPALMKGSRRRRPRQRHQGGPRAGRSSWGRCHGRHVQHEDPAVILRYSNARWPALPLPAEP